MRTYYSRTTRIISVVTLTFFSWTFMSLWEIPAALAAEKQKSDSGHPNNIGAQGLSIEGQFEKVLEDIRETAGKAGDRVAKNEDASLELETIKAKRTEIDSLRAELRKEFGATGKRLKDGKLPSVIISRHEKFVESFERNYKELQNALNAVEQAKKKEEKQRAYQKAKAFLEKTRPQRKSVPLDPNRLPVSARKVKAPREPRTKEQFEKDFPKQKHKNLAADQRRLTLIENTKAFGRKNAQEAQGFSSELTQINANENLYLNPVAAGFSLREVSKQNRIQLAYNGPMSDMPLEIPLSSSNKLPFPIAGEGQGLPSKDLIGGEGAISQIAFSDSILNFESGILNLAQAVAEPLVIAQATSDLPTEADLASTPEINLDSPIIRAKAQELGCSPVRIYEEIRNSIEYAPTYGSIQGAEQCLQSRICNDTDTASALIALYRSCGIPARYNLSTVQLDIDRAMNLVGGVTDPKMVGTILATNGVPVTLLKTSSGVYKYVRMERVTARVFVDYIPSRGAVHKQGDTWIQLDPSFKQINFKRGLDLYSAMGINGEKYLQDYITDTSSLTIPAELQTSFPAYTISPYQYYSKRLFNYLDTNFPSATYQDVFGADTIEASSAIIKKEYPYLMGTLPYSVVTQGASFASIPDSLRHKVNFMIEGTTASDASLTYTASLPEIAGKRITLSSVPATASDEALVNQYGTMLNVPPYLLSVKIVLKINGVTVATGSPIGLGKEQTFSMTFIMPNIGTEIVTNTVTAGDYSAVPIISYKVPFTLAGDKMETLINNIGSSDLDDLLGQMLYNVGVSYFHHLNFEEELYAKNFQMIITKGLSEAIVTSHAATDSLWGVPYKISEGGIGIDVDKNEYFPFPYDGSTERSRDFMIVSGLGSSAWEDRVLQAFYDVPSVSAARLLRFASQQGVPIYTIDGSNINATLPQLQVSSEVIDDIRNAVNAGKKVIISKTGVQYEGMNSIGYIILDPSTGAAGYMIGGGLAGGMSSQPDDMSVRDVTQYLRDGSALRTIFGRSMVVMYALAQLGTPYRTGFEDPGPMGGADPDKGFDCSGLVYYLFTTVYNKHIFGPERLWTVDRQHRYLLEKKMTHPYEAKLDGDILWSDNYGHTGIYYGIHALLPGETLVTDSVIHANRGKWFSAVIITSTNNAAFTGAPSGSRMPDIGRPVP